MAVAHPVRILHRLRVKLRHGHTVSNNHQLVRLQRLPDLRVRHQELPQDLIQLRHLSNNSITGNRNRCVEYVNVLACRIYSCDESCLKYVDLYCPFVVKRN